MKTDTIAAIATGLTESGIGIIRVSGQDAVDVADAVFRTKSGRKILKSVESHTIHYGFIVEKEKQQVIDEVMVSVMKGPRSYTGEDVVEINCHGGVLVMRRILETVLESGARLAEPGEFTKRAFLNGRIDLTEAEAVMDVIQSRNEWALRSSVRQLQGSVSDEIKRIRAAILYEIAFIESALDDPEHISLDGYPERLKEKLEQWNSVVEKWIRSAGRGQMLKEGIRTVILGKPNVGKSSLLNILLGEERAIVTDVAGTTRDVLQEYVSIRGVGFHIMDTAGIHATDDKVERIGVEKAKLLASEADLIIYVVDASENLDESDREIVPLILEKNTIILLNKSDLGGKVSEEDIRKMIGKEDVRIIRTSMIENTGLDEFEKTVSEMFFEGTINMNNEITITNLRHKEALQDTEKDLERVMESVLSGMPEDFFTIDLMSAYAALGRIIGEEVGEDLINEIFSKFCMGK